MTPGDRLEWALRMMGKKQKEAAHELGITQTALSNWIRGYSGISTKGLISIYEQFKISPDFILFGLEGNLNEEWQARWRLML